MRKRYYDRCVPLQYFFHITSTSCSRNREALKAQARNRASQWVNDFLPLCPMLTFSRLKLHRSAAETPKQEAERKIRQNETAARYRERSREKLREKARVNIAKYADFFAFSCG